MIDTRTRDRLQEQEDAKRLQRLHSHHADREEARGVLADLQAEMVVLRQAIEDAEGANSVAQLQYDVTLKACMGRGLVDRDGRLVQKPVCVAPAIGV